MLPNVCFPLFPVVDYPDVPAHVLRRRTRHESTRPASTWIVRGLHPPARSTGLVYHDARIDAGRRVTCRRACAVRGGQLPALPAGLGAVPPDRGHAAPVRLQPARDAPPYYLASSFTDYWRRINIYWKDFMVKLFFNPAFVPAASAWAPTAALVGGDARRVRDDLAAARLPVVLAARHMAAVVE